jgi:hypothetical protein
LTAQAEAEPFAAADRHVLGDFQVLCGRGSWRVPRRPLSWVFGKRGRRVFEFRVTKYNPAHRDRRVYTRDEWISVCQIGQSFDGVVLTEQEYQRVEDAYATAAVAFLREAGVPSLVVADLENHASVPLPFAEGSELGLIEVGEVVRQLLRAEFWCRLGGREAFVHVGYDYYMYIGVPEACPNAKALARQLGLFVESSSRSGHHTASKGRPNRALQRTAMSLAISSGPTPSARVGWRGGR